MAGLYDDLLPSAPASGVKAPAAPSLYSDLIPKGPKTVQTKTLPPSLGGGAFNFNPDNPEELINSGHSDYGGTPSEKGMQRDDIVPVSLGGKNTSKDNVRLEPTNTKGQTATDPIEKAVLADYKAGRLTLNAARQKVLFSKMQEEHLAPSDKEQSVAGNFLPAVADTLTHPIKTVAEEAKGAFNFLLPGAKDIAHGITTGDWKPYIESSKKYSEIPAPTTTDAKGKKVLNPEFLDKVTNLFGGFAEGEANIGKDIEQEIVHAAHGEPAHPTEIPHTTEAPHTEEVKGTVPPEETPKGPEPTPAHTAAENLKTFLNQSPEAKFSEDLEWNLNELRTNRTADDIEAKKQWDNMREISTKEEAEKVHDYSDYKEVEKDLTPQQKEAMKPVLTPREQALYEHFIRPVQQQSAKLFHELRGAEIPVEDSFHTSRNVAERGGWYDKIVQQAQEGAERLSGGGSSLRKTTPQFKRRTMRIAIDPEGNRSVISMKDGKILQWNNGKPTYVGRYNRVGDESFTSNTGTPYKISEAITKEIEQHTNLRYHKDIRANELHAYTQLRSASRATKFLNSLKESPEFQSFAVKHGTENPPPGWRPSSLPQLRGYDFHPKVADALDNFSRSLSHDPNGVEKLNQFLISTVFINPFVDVPNTVINSFVNRGIANWANVTAYPRLFRTTAKSVADILTLSEDYQKVLRSGVSLKYAGSRGTLYDQIVKDTFSPLKNATTMGKIAGALHTYPAALWHGVMKWSNGVMGFVRDVATLQSIKELQEKGYSFDDAIHQTTKFLPGQPLPARVLGSRTASKILTNPNLAIYSELHYGNLRAWGNMMGDLVKAVPAEKKFEALSKLGAAGLLLFGILPAMDKVVQAVSGNPQGKARRAGLLSIPYYFSEVLKGNLKFGQAVQTTIATPSPLLRLGGMALTGKDMYTGQDFQQPGESLPSAIGKATQIYPVQSSIKVGSGEQSAPSFLASQLGFSLPKNSPSLNKVYSAIYNDFPALTKQVRSLYEAGDTEQMNKVISDYNSQLETNMIQTMKDNGYNISDENALREWIATKSGIKRFFLKTPTAKQMENYQNSKQHSGLENLLTP